MNALAANVRNDSGSRAFEYRAGGGIWWMERASRRLRMRLSAGERRTGREGGHAERGGNSENAQLIDARGKTILPGLWDMHAHFEQVEWGRFISRRA